MADTDAKPVPIDVAVRDLYAQLLRALMEDGATLEEARAESKTLCPAIDWV